MMVAGVVQSMTGESAQRAALGAGAIVMDMIASNDGRLPHEKIDRIRKTLIELLLVTALFALVVGAIAAQLEARFDLTPAR